MNKELLERFLKSNIPEGKDFKVYNDRALLNAQYPYVVLNSSKANITDYPRVDVSLEIDIWDKESSFSSVNRIADMIQNGLDRQSFVDDHIVGTFYLDTRINMDDEDKSLKRNHMTFDVEIYFKED